ncbi:hypothetical protein [Streptomyces rhizosphaericus]|uniref:Uncharacterized protein n=1 Tax=Streptomyces rhizosphaericus TaxID=114699 RepID=A0A6G4A944_9ACTN|nr:hypothetical protein [Streptomyces rhizosphaericus]NEW69883.1 hypothetical protein [Streptomyces rhizosphaericus]
MTSLSSVTGAAMAIAGPHPGQVVGFQAGWALKFRKDDGKGFPVEADPLRLTHAHYEADIKVEADTTLRGGTFDVTVDGMLDRDFDAIAAGEYVHLEIRLGWRDLRGGFSGALAGVASAFAGGGRGEDEGFHEVMAGRVLRVERNHGEFTYRARFQGIDARYHRMQSSPPRIGTMAAGRTVVDYARRLCQEDTAVGVSVVGEGKATTIDGVLDIAADGSVVQALREIARLAHGGDRRFEVPMFLRGDELHVGRWTAPVSGGESWELTPATGLVESRPVVERDPDAVPLKSPFAAPEVRRFDLTLLGRPDIALGDETRASLPNPSPAGLTGTVSGSPIGPLGDTVAGIGRGSSSVVGLADYGVVGVSHLLGPVEGFVTRLTVERMPPHDRSAAGPAPGTSDESARLAAALAEQRRRAALERRTHEVGLVRRQDVVPTFTKDHDVPAQTLAVDEGLADAPAPNVPTRAPAASPTTQLFNKPYLTPFAFDGAGLVVPHYPGMRVVSLHYREERQNAVVAGALWEEGFAPNSHLGDWWLCLPTNLVGTDTKGQSAAEPVTAPRPKGPASHDLISGEGNRTIQVRGLRISVGTPLMKDVGKRPDDAPADHLVIEHAASNARISIDDKGNIEITTDADLTLTANKITLRPKTHVEVL